MENNDIDMCSNCAHYSDPGPRSMDMGWCIVHEQSSFCNDHCVCYNRKHPPINFAEEFAKNLVNVQPIYADAFNDILVICDTMTNKETFDGI